MSLIFIDNRDGEQYRVVRVGNQLWFAENLRYHVGENCSAYEHNYIAYAKYGYLYSSSALAAACPRGCRLPTEMDFRQLFSYVGRCFKNVDLATALAYESWGEGLDYLGLGFMPGGCGFKKEDEFFEIGRRGFFWTASTGSNGFKKFLSMGADSVRFDESGKDIDLYSVRLIVDEGLT